MSSPENTESSSEPVAEGELTEPELRNLSVGSSFGGSIFNVSATVKIQGGDTVG